MNAWDPDKIDGSGEAGSTADLLARIREGDDAARERLVRRYLPALQRWARGRLPARARDLTDSDDLVQITFLSALDRLEGFEHRHQGAFLAYLRRILRNAIVDQIRRTKRHPPAEPLPEGLAEGGPSPLEEAIGTEALESYEVALAELPERHQEAIMLRLEMGFTYPEIAEALDFPSSNAVRMMVSRAVLRLSEVMDER